MSILSYDDKHMAWYEPQSIFWMGNDEIIECMSAKIYRDPYWEEKWTSDTSKKYNYGDGSLNLVSDGYNDTNLYVNDTPASKVFSKFTYCHAGNCAYNLLYNTQLGTVATLHHTPYSSSHSFQVINAGTNIITLKAPITGGDGTVNVMIHGGVYTSQSYIWDLYLLINNAYRSLQQCVESQLIKPIVLINSGADSGWYLYQNCTNIYNNSSSISQGDYAVLSIRLMVNQGYILTGLKFTANRQYSITYNDGLSVAHYKDSYLNLGKK